MKISILGLGLSFCMIANGCLSIQVEMYPTTSSEAVSQEGENPQEVLQEVWKENSGRKYTAEDSSSQDAAQGDSKSSETGKSTDLSSNAASAANYEETELSISSATDFWNGCAVVEQNGTFGLINEAGQVLIDPMYDHIGVFDETGSYAPVRVGDVEYFINQKNEPALTFDGAYENLGIFSKGAATVSVKGTYGYIDTKSQTFDGAYENLGIFSKGAATVSVKGTYGYIDTKSHHSDFLWDYTSPIYNGMGAVQKDGKWALVDLNLEELTEYCYDDIARNEFGICSAQKNVFVKEGEKWAMLGENASFVASAIYEDVKPFADGCGYAAVKKDGKWGFVTFLSSELREFSFEDAKSFCGELAAVKKDDKWGVIDTSLEFVIEPIFDEVLSMTNSGCLIVKENDTCK